jgi:hypothetical protein
MELHGDPRDKVWSTSAPLPGAGAPDAAAGGPAGAAAHPQQLEDSLAQHMLLLDLEEDLDYEEDTAAVGPAPAGAPGPAPREARGQSSSGRSTGSGGGASPTRRRRDGSPSRERAAGGSSSAQSAAEALAARQQRSAPLAPTGFTPAEVGGGGEARGWGGRVDPRAAPPATQPLAPPCAPPLPAAFVCGREGMGTALASPTHPAGPCWHPTLPLDPPPRCVGPATPQAYVDREERTVRAREALGATVPVSARRCAQESGLAAV